MMLNKIKKKAFLKILAIIATIFIALTLIVWLALPSFLKNYIESNDIDWINREISIEKVGINLFQGKISLYNTIINEPDNETIFLSFDKLLVNFNFRELIQKNISTDNVTLTNLVGNITQNGDLFNFSDLITSDNSEETEESSESLNYILRNMTIENATINYTDAIINSNVILDSITITNKIFSKSDTVFDADVAIHQYEGGWLKGNIAFNLENDDYDINAEFLDLQLAPFKTYVSSGIRLNEFSGAINANIEIAGNTSTNYIKSKGQATVTDFNITDPENKPLINIGTFLVDINQIDSKANIYSFKEIAVKDSNIYFEYLPNGDNFTKLLVNSTTTSEENNKTDYYVSPFEMLSVYIYDMTKEYIFKSYTADKIELSNFNLKFHDYTLEDAFQMDLQDLNIVANNIKPENLYANFNLDGKINKTGTIKGDISVSRTGVENMKVDIDINGLFLNRFSPYGRFYTGHTFLEGISSFKNTSEIKDSYLTSTNILHVEQITVSKKNKTQSGHSLPLRLAASLMKDSNGNINLEIPIEGPINDPKYKFGKIIWQVVKNIFTKTASSPVKALSNLFNTNEDDLKNIYFDNGQIGLSIKQKKPLEAISKVLNKKPELNIELHHLYNIDYEMDAIALKIAKANYLKQSNMSLDSEKPIGKQAFDLPSTDPGFLEFLKTKTPNFDETISVPENARRLIGATVVEEKLTAITAKQKQIIKDYLITEEGILENRFIIKDGSTTDAALNQTSPKFEVAYNVNE